MGGFTPTGIKKLSELTIDVVKDWLANRIANIGVPTTAGDALRKGTRLTAAEMLDGAADLVLTGQGAGSSPAYAAVPSSQQIAPYVGVKWDYLLSVLGSEQFGHLGNIPSTSLLHRFSTAVGGLGLFLKLGVAGGTTATLLISLLDFSAQTLATSPAGMDVGLCSEIVSSRYIYVPLGQLAGTRQSQLYQYDLLKDSYATKAAITTLNASYRFDNQIGIHFDGSDLLYFFGIFGGVDNSKTVSYSISGNSYTNLAAFPLGSSFPGPSTVQIGGDIYLHRGGTSNVWYKYNIAGDSWTALTAPTSSPSSPWCLANPANADQIWLFGGAAGTADVQRYSIAGDSWTTLGSTNAPGVVMNGKGVYYATPVPHVLVLSYGSKIAYLYKF